MTKPKQNNRSFKVREEEKELYRISKELELYGRSGFSFSDRKKQQNIARTLGVRGKLIIENDLLFPVTLARHHGVNVIAVPPNVSVKSKKIFKGWRFSFHRK